jgi:hypothetical protein
LLCFCEQHECGTGGTSTGAQQSRGAEWAARNWQQQKEGASTSASANPK